MPTDLPSVQLFTDGACSGNPGPGGWAFILRDLKTDKEIERFGVDEQTTNNRMELMAAIEGLAALKKPAQVELVTDSEYVTKGLSQWMPKWKANGWTRGRNSRDKSPLKNLDLWQRLDELAASHEVSVTHVDGHAGHPENERCDELAVAAYQKFLRRR